MAKRGENIYKRKDGRWEARVIKGYNEQGKAVYAYFYGKSYKEAKDKMFMSLPYVDCKPIITSAAASTSARQTSAPQKVSDTISFEALLDRWLDNSKIRLKESSYVKYHNLVHNHIKPALGKYPLSEITNAEINRFIADKLKANRAETGNGKDDGGSSNDGNSNSKPKRLSEKTVKDILSVIKAALHFAKDESLIANININVALPKEKPKDMRVLSIDEQTALEKYLCTDMDESKLGIYLCLYTGLRIGEACSLLWGDISLDKGVLTVNRTMQRIQVVEGSAESSIHSSAKTKMIITDPKSNFSVRTIPLPECLISKLQQFRPTDLHTHNDTYLLTGETGRYVEPRTLQNHLKAYLSRCGIKDANFHSLRHTFATRCVALGFEVKALSEILGHSNVNITLNRYVHPSVDMKRSNMDKLTALC